MRADRERPRAGARTIVLFATLGFLFGACGGDAPAPGELGGFWFFSFEGRSDATEGAAFAYVTIDGRTLGGGVAAVPVGGPLTGSLDGRELMLTLEDVDGAPVISVEARVRAERTEGSWTVEGSGASGRFTARRFEPSDYPPEENPFLGTWNNFEDGGVTTLRFGDDYRFTGSEGDLEFAGQYGFSTRHRLVGVYEADAQSVHMEKLTYRFTDEDTVVLNGSVYRREDR
jgi:hypothetical protein